MHALALVQPAPKRERTFEEVHDEVAARAALAFPDQVVSLANLRVNEECLVEVPRLGALALTTWSQAQLARMLGIRWDRWFDATLVSASEQADEVNRRLARKDGLWKVRTRRQAPDEDRRGEGVLRAFVGEHYQPLDDVRAFERLAGVLGKRTGDFSFTRSEHTDRCSYYAAVSQEDLDLGRGSRDPHRLGFTLKNSEVGASSVVIMEYVLRLVCTNGLLLAMEGKRLFARVHRATADESLDRDLAYAFARLPQRWEAATSLLRQSRALAVENPEQAVRDLLASEPGLRVHTDAVLKAYREEPEATRFGLVQAVTRAAKSLDADERYDLEAFAGRMIAMEAS